MASRLENYVLFVTTLTAFFAIFLSSAVMMAVPTLAGEFGMSNIVQNWISTIYLLSLAVVTIPVGQISSKYGLKKTMIIGLIIFIITTTVIMFSTSQDMFLILRIIQGAGSGIITVSATAMLVSAFSPEERGKALGINAIGICLAAIVSPIFAGYLNNSFGWRSIFLFTIPFLVLCLVLLFTEIKKEWKTLEGVPIDIKGIILYSFGIFLFVFGFTTLNRPDGIIYAIAGLIILVVFGFMELKTEHPVFNVGLFKNPKFLTSNVAALAAYFAMSVIFTIMNYHLQYIRGFNSQEAGMLLIIAPVLQVIMSPISGSLSDKINPQILAAIGGVIGAVGIIMIIFLSKEVSLVLVIISFILLGLGFGLFSPANTNEIMGSVPKKETSMASASYSVMRVVGQTMSMGIFTFVFAIVMGNVPIIPENYHLLIQSSQITAVICTVVCIISVVVSIIGVRSKGYYNSG
ncbi:MAG: MFS transporter [Methanobrevibacter sp.]|uniref:MFS transporter n=1 Tax=Methanobrevibacter sp. TaxID=66852 RepID=UPI0026DECEB6|nr:MFS transporter [Methanobrevibacter sp.]MDO5848612.1 MFS transporter [Methanobrevibacter sp.]